MSNETHDGTDEPTRYEMQAPAPIGLEQTGSDDLINLITSGIVNPMGPTLNILAIQGSADPGTTRPVVHLMLHPFARQANRVGSVRMGTRASVEGFELFFPGLQRNAGCPTLILPNGSMAPDAATKTVAAFMLGFAHALDTLVSVRRFPGDPWARVKDEMDAEPKSSIDAERALTQDEAVELAMTQLNNENARSELQAFLFAWKGSIEFQAGFGSKLANTAMPLEELAGFLALLAPTTNLSGLTDA